MADVFSARKRSEIMRAVPSCGSKAERRVLEILQALRRKPTLNDRSLPGAPDFAFHRVKRAIFVDGCFWHRHSCAGGMSMPAQNRDYWLAKFERNRRNDRRVRSRLRRLGWRVMTIWECQTQLAGIPQLRTRISKFLA